MSLLIRLSIACLLFVASTMKSLDFVERYGVQAGTTVNLYGGLLAAQVELVLCLLLLFGFRLGALRKLLIAIFSLFAMKSAYSVCVGETDCGCFGSHVSVPPSVMLIVDVLIIGTLVFVRRSPREGQRGQHHML